MPFEQKLSQKVKSNDSKKVSCFENSRSNEIFVGSSPSSVKSPLLKPDNLVSLML